MNIEGNTFGEKEMFENNFGEDTNPISATKRTETLGAGSTGKNEFQIGPAGCGGDNYGATLGDTVKQEDKISIR